MRALRGLGKVSLALVLTVVLTAVQLIPRPSRLAYAAETAAPPQPVPEDPLGQQPEQGTPEISIDVDVRDGHLTVRVVDIWGPGRVPLVVRSYTNTQTPSNAGAPSWWFNVPTETGRDAAGNSVTYKYSTTEWNGTAEKWDVYVDDIGTYTTMKAHFTCVPGLPGGTPVPPPPGRPSGQRPPATPVPPGPRNLGPRPLAPPECTQDTTTIYLPKGATRTYAVNGTLTEQRDANGNVTTFTYTTLASQIRPYLATIRDPVGRVTTYTYEQAYQECVAEGPNGQCLQWKSNYRVARVTDPYGRFATYTYTRNDQFMQLASVTNAAGRTTSYTYLPNGGPLTSLTNPRGFTTTITGASQYYYTRVTRVAAPDGSATTYAYPQGSATQVTQATVTNARGYTTTYDLYAGPDENYSGNVVKVTDPLNNITQYAYDARHNVTQVTDARGNRTTYAYTSRNKVTQVVKAAGTLNLTTTATWDGNDNLLSVTNPRGVPTTYTYDTKNNLTQVKTAAGTRDESFTQYFYTTWGGVASVIDPRGNTTSYTYTARRQVQSIIPPVGGATSFTYNSFDDQITKTDGNGPGHTWTTAYDASRLVTSVTDPLGNTVAFWYDENGNRIRAYDAKTQFTSFTYDNRDRLITITDPLNGLTRYAYDPVSNLTQITNARNLVAATFIYDADNRLTQVRDALTHPTTYQYDAVGNRTQMTDRKTQITTYTYDQANRLTQASAGGQTLTYTYDPNGNRARLVDPTGTTTYTYDTLDRLTQTLYPDGQSVQASYDPASNRITLTNPGGVTTTAVYDAGNRLIQMAQGTLTWTFGYDGAGNRTRQTHPNGTRTDYAYLTNHWLSSITHKKSSGSPFQSFAYTYDPNGNRLTQVDSTGTTTFTYDALNRLTSAAYPGYGTRSWTYDAVGNRTSQEYPCGSAVCATVYTYDANNRLTQAGSTTYAYDNNGNVTAISSGPTFTWDVFNRMTQATGPGGTVIYTYNGDGLKVRRVATPADTTLTFGVGGAGWLPLRGDWNGDGTDTVGAYNPATGTFYLRNSNTTGTADLTFVFGPAAAGRIPLAGDWDGNGTDTVGVYDPATGTFSLRNSNTSGPADLTFAFGSPGLTPLAGDWNGDRTDTIGVYNGATATFSLRNSNSAGAADVTFAFGPAGAGRQPVTGDWNGDALDTIGVYDPATATFSLRNTNSAGAADLTFTYGPAGAGWKPLAGDWNGDGTETVGVYNPATGAFTLRNASGPGAQETTKYYYDGIRPIWETDGAGALLSQEDRDLFGNLLSRRLANNARRYYHYDGLGSTTALTTETGTVAATLLFDAWGSVRAASGGGQGTYRFTGAEYEATTGLYHMGARFYDPTIGRWLSEDPVQDKPFQPATLNFYAYVGNNPALYIDPKGTASEDPGWVGDTRTAAQRLQDEINARLEFERIIGNLRSRGLHRLADALQGALNSIASIFRDLSRTVQYIDFQVNVQIVPGVNFTFGGIYSVHTGISHFYAGLSIGTAGGSLTAGTSQVQPGLNAQISYAGSGFTGAYGQSLDCSRGCEVYREWGVGTGYAVAVFWIF